MGKGSPHTLTQVLYWVYGSTLTLFVFSLLLMLPVSLFLESYFAHCALLYIISKNFSNMLDSYFDFRRRRQCWFSARKRVVLTTISIVNELLVLYVRYSTRLEKKVDDLPFMIILGVALLAMTFFM